MNRTSNGAFATNTKRKKRRFNFIDFLLIIIALGIIFAAIYLFVPNSLFDKIGDTNTSEIQYTVEIKGVDQEFINKIKENDTVIDSVTKNVVGTVEAVSFNNNYSELEYDKENSKGVLAVYPDKYYLVVTINATAIFKAEAGYTVNGCRIAVGEKMYLRFPNYSSECYCIDVPRMK